MSASKRTDGISICIPNWNHRNYLFRSVSCALLTAKELAKHGVGCEVLILDDYSRDGSQRLMLRLAMMDTTGCLHAVAGTTNCGLGAMRTRSVVESRYKWVCFLDADNELIPENLIQFYRAAKETGAGVVYGNIVVKNDSTGNAIEGFFSNDIIHDGFLDTNYVDAMSVVDAEQAIAIGGYTDARGVPEDWEFLLHLIAEGKQLVFVPALLGIYHKEGMSLVQEMDDNHKSRFSRIYNQRKTGLAQGFRSRVYHPELGYLI
jgi:glycosyltransferase involved in cell wall biosynthesis